MIGAGHHGLAAMGRHRGGDLAACRWRPRPGRCRRPPPAAAHGRSSAGRRYPAAACRAGGWRPCGRESAPGCGSRSSGEVWARKRGRKWWGLAESRGVYTGCQSPGKPISQPCSGVRRESLIPEALRGRSPAYVDLPAWSLIQMDSFELNKILGAVLGTCLVLLVTNFAARRFSRPEAGEAGLRDRREGRPGHGGGKAAAAAPSEPIEKLLQTASVEKGAGAPRNAGPATPSRRAARTASVRTSMASSARRRARAAAGSISRPP